MSQTKTPPWERTSREGRTSLERYVLSLWYYGDRKVAEQTWSELCALQAVAEAVEKYLTLNPTQENVALAWVQIEAALKEWRALCPR